LITLIMLEEEYKLWSSSLCSFLHLPVTSSLFGPTKKNIKWKESKKLSEDRTAWRALCETSTP
jgi:hypothetical protein